MGERGGYHLQEHHSCPFYGSRSHAPFPRNAPSLTCSPGLRHHLNGSLAASRGSDTRSPDCPGTRPRRGPSGLSVSVRTERCPSACLRPSRRGFRRDTGEQGDRVSSSDAGPCSRAGPRGSSSARCGDRLCSLGTPPLPRDWLEAALSLLGVRTPESLSCSARLCPAADCHLGPVVDPAALRLET